MPSGNESSQANRHQPREAEISSWASPEFAHQPPTSSPETAPASACDATGHLCLMRSASRTRTPEGIGPKHNVTESFRK